MAAFAPIENIQNCKEDLEKFKSTWPDQYDKIVLIIHNHRGIGYKNIAKLMFGKTPKELKE